MYLGPRLIWYVIGSLSDAVGHVTMDEKHEEYRQRLRTLQATNGTDHIVAGLRGFGLGLYGGLTSIVSQTYTGATQEGIPVSYFICINKKRALFLT